MIIYENDCCDCGLNQCAYCDLRHTPHHYCDLCGEEIFGEPYESHGLELHGHCAREEYPEDFEDDEDE